MEFVFCISRLSVCGTKCTVSVSESVSCSQKYGFIDLILVGGAITITGTNLHHWFDIWVRDAVTLWELTSDTSDRSAVDVEIVSVPLQL